MPINSKVYKAIYDNLTPAEKETYISHSKQCNLKLSLSFLPSILLFILLSNFFEVTLHIGIVAAIGLLNIFISIFFISLPSRKKKIELLNNSTFAKDNKIHL